MNKRSMLKRLFRTAILSTIICVIQTGCMKDELPQFNEQRVDRVEFKLNIPTNTQVVTRANTLASEAELQIQSGYCLIYGDNVGTSLPKMAYLFDVSQDIANNGTINPTITIPKKVAIESTDVVVFIFNTQFSGDGSFGDRLDDVQYGQISTKFPLSGVFGFESTTNGLPMYGELTGFSSAGGVTPTATIYRSVAKVQVKLKSPMSGSAANIGNFTTANIKYQIFNLAIAGCVDHGSGFNGTTTDALNSSDQNEAPKTTINGLPIDLATVTNASGDNYTGASYIYEYYYSDHIIGAGGSTAILANTPNSDRLVMILHNSDNSRYYRLDLCNVGPEYIDVIRNHHYQIVINEVNSDGYASADEALNGDASNIVYEIIDNTGNTTISNGKYAISVGEELYANKYISALGSAPITVIADLRYIIPAGLTLPAGITNSITCIDNVTGSTIGSGTLTLSHSMLSAVATPLAVTFVDPNYVGEIAFKITLGDLVYQSAPIYTVLPVDANCHIVPMSGKTIAIVAADRVNAFWGAAGDGNIPANVIDGSTEWYAEIIWADFDYSVGNKVTIQQSGATAADYGLGVEEGVHVTVGSLTKPGNVIIGIKKKGANTGVTEYLWSWHLWITDYDPDTRTDSEAWSVNNAFSTIGGQVHSYSDDAGVTFWSGAYNGSVVMDRNLGAIVSAGADGATIDKVTSEIDAYGMHYQWGRKDPLPYAKDATGAFTDTWGRVVGTWPNSVAGVKSKAYSTNNPHQFISNGSDWQPADNDSWMDGFGVKSLYDPCPDGWRVPHNDMLSNATTTNLIVSGTEGNADYGRSYSVGGNIDSWFPASGFCYRDTGILDYVGIYGTYWSSTPNGAQSKFKYFFSYGVYNISVDRSYAFSIRCLKD